MNMESRCSRKLWYSDGDNYCPRLHVTKNIARSHDCELFIKVFVGMRKNSVAYRGGMSRYVSLKSIYINSLKNERK